MNELKETAEMYRLGLLANFFDVAQVIVWADSVIESEAKPPIAIIETSMGKGRLPEDIARELAALPGTFDRLRVIQRLFAQMGNVLSQDASQAKRIAYCLYLLAAREKIPVSEDEILIWTIDDELDLAEQGICGDVSKLTEQLKLFLRTYGNKQP